MKSKSITGLPGLPDAFSDGAEAEAFIFVPAPASQTSATNQTSTTNLGPQLYGALAPTEEYTASVQSVSSSAAGTTVAVTNGGMTFDLTFDVGAPASFMTGIEQAALMLSATISDKITVNLNIHYTGTGGGAFAGPSTGLYEDYSAIRSDLINQASPGDTTFNALVNTSSIAGQSLVAVWNSQLKALGLMSPTNSATDGSATFATDINSSLLIGVALHELTHALGRVPYGSAPDIFDLYRFTSPGAQLFTGGNTAVASYFSVDGGNTDLADYGLHSDPSDFLNPGPTFLGGPYSNLTPGDPFNELYGTGTLQGLTAVDKKLLDALGFHLTSANGISLTATSAQAVQGGAAVGLLNGSPVITDAASTTLSSATIKVAAAAGNIFPGDELFLNGAQSGVVDGGRVTVSWNDSTKILTLAGVASIADYQTLLSEISYQWTGIDSSTGSHTPHTVTWTVHDGTWNLGTTSVITIERPPVAAVANVVLNPNAATVAASSLLTASDPDGDAIATYAFKDSGTGHFLLNGVAQPNNQEIDVTAAQLSLLTYENVGAVDSVQARVSDGTLWSSWQPFTVTGPTPTVIEAFGSTRLDLVGSNFYLDPVSGGSGPTLKMGGAAVVTGQFDPYVPVGVEQTSGGYEVALKNAGTGQFSIWQTDSSGKFLSYSVYAGNSAALESLETSFHQDLNGDGVIGVPSATVTAIEAFGSTKLDVIGNNYFLDPVSGGTGPSLKYAGTAVDVGQFDPYTPVAVEQTAGGYEVALKNSGTGQFSIWNTDSSGNFLSYSVYAGNSAALESLETSFHQDLNGDGVIGVPAASVTAIEAFGSTKLDLIGSDYFLDPLSGGIGPSLKYAGTAVEVGQFDPYTPVGVEQTAGGYEVALKNAGTNQFSIWNTDSNGNFVSYSVYSGTSTALEALETSFHQDLNGDGVIGIPAATATVIEAFGSTSLVEAGNNYFLDSISNGTSLELKFGGVAVVAGQFGAYTPVGVEQTAGGYEVALQNAGANLFSIWNTDSSGNFISYSVYSGTSTALESLETSFHQDLNGDGVIGIPAAAAPVTVASNDTFVFSAAIAANSADTMLHDAFTSLTSNLLAISANDVQSGHPPVSPANISLDTFVNPVNHESAAWLSAHLDHLHDFFIR